MFGLDCFDLWMHTTAIALETPTWYEKTNSKIYKAWHALHVEFDFLAQSINFQITDGEQDWVYFGPENSQRARSDAFWEKAASNLRDLLRKRAEFLKIWPRTAREVFDLIPLNNYSLEMNLPTGVTLMIRQDANRGPLTSSAPSTTVRTGGLTYTFPKGSLSAEERQLSLRYFSLFSHFIQSDSATREIHKRNFSSTIFRAHRLQLVETSKPVRGVPNSRTQESQDSRFVVRLPVQPVQSSQSLPPSITPPPAFLPSPLPALSLPPALTPHLLPPSHTHPSHPQSPSYSPVSPTYSPTSPAQAAIPPMSPPHREWRQEYLQQGVQQQQQQQHATATAT